ncbi:MAG: zinc-dependent alcohol dehydrogenase [bacterium]
MKAAILHAPEDLRIEDVPIPAMDEESILVKIHKASICGSTDYNVFKGWYQKINPSLKYPHIMGHEASGEVIEVGENVKGIKVGDRVAWGGIMEGAFAEFISIKPRKTFITKLSENLSYEEGTLLEPLYGVLRGIYSLRMRAGDRVMVLGCGPIGLIFIQCIRLSMAREIIGIDLYERRLLKALELGADITINPNLEPEWYKGIGEVDVVIDTTGSAGGNLIDIGVEILKPGGKYMIYGHPMEKTSFTPMKLSSKGVDIVGVLADFQESQRMMELAERLVSKGLIDLKRLISHRIKLEEIVDWIRLCGERKEEVLKVVIDIETF